VKTFSAKMSDGKKGIPIWVWILVAPVALVGFFMVASIAVFGVRKYLVKAKQAEARASLTTWSAGLVSCTQRDGQLPPTSRPVPAELSDVKGKKYQSSAADWSEPAHKCAGFSLSEPQYFQYQWELRSANEGVVKAIADLDGDGIMDSVLGVGIVCNAGSCSLSSMLSVDDAGRAKPGDIERLSSATAIDAPAVREASPAAAAPPPGAAPALPLSGSDVDLSTVMGRARKLADAWQPEAALLGIEATFVDGRLRATDTPIAKLTFGPSAFDATRTRSGLFVVVYDKTGVNGAPAAGVPSKPLPEPMCAPERVLSRLASGAEGPVTLRYGWDAAQRPMWLANSQSHPKDVRLFDPQDCQVRGLVGPRKR
jgi:hypothetical protein